MLKLTPKVAAICIALLIAVAAISYVAVNALSTDPDDKRATDVAGGYSTTPTPAPVIGGLLVPNRDRYAICVDTYESDPALATLAKQRFATALVDASTHHYWSRAVGSLAPTVDVGCPAPPAVFDPNAVTERSGFGLFVGAVTFRDVASEYKTFVYVIPDSLLRSTIGGLAPFATQEVLRLSHDHFSPVTWALFVTPEQLEDSDYLRQLILVAIGAVGVEGIPYPYPDTTLATTQEPSSAPKETASPKPTDSDATQ